MASEQKTDSLPVVHGVWINALNQDESQHMALRDSTCADISGSLSAVDDRDLSDLVSEWETKPLRSKHSFTAHIDGDDKCYALYVLHASSQDKALFLVRDDTPFVKTVDLEDASNSHLILPFLDGALVRFLERAEVYGG